jgi:hypothetical protein
MSESIMDFNTLNFDTGNQFGTLGHQGSTAAPQFNFMRMQQNQNQRRHSYQPVSNYKQWQNFNGNLNLPHTQASLQPQSIPLISFPENPEQNNPNNKRRKMSSPNFLVESLDQMSEQHSFLNAAPPTDLTNAASLYMQTQNAMTQNAMTQSAITQNAMKGQSRRQSVEEVLDSSNVQAAFSTQPSPDILQLLRHNSNSNLSVSGQHSFGASASSDMEFFQMPIDSPLTGQLTLPGGNSLGTPMSSQLTPMCQMPVGYADHAIGPERRRSSSSGTSAPYIPDMRRNSTTFHSPSAIQSQIHNRQHSAPGVSMSSLGSMQSSGFLDVKSDSHASFSQQLMHEPLQLDAQVMNTDQAFNEIMRFNGNGWDPSQLQQI